MTTQLGAGRGWLTAAAARSIARLDGVLGHPMQITEAGRTWAQQNAHFQAYRRYLAGGPWAPIALSPDAPSIHQLGNAIDTDEGQQHVGLLAEHGWVRTVYRAGKLVEPWHFEYATNRDTHLGEEPDMALNAETDYPAFSAMLQRALQFDVRPNGVGADWRLGATIWERLNQVQAAATAGIDLSDDAAEVIAAAIPDDIAKQVADELAKRLTN